MYSWLWYHLPGPKWVKALIFVWMLALVAYVLFEFAFPVLNEMIFDPALG